MACLSGERRITVRRGLKALSILRRSVEEEQAKEEQAKEEEDRKPRTPCGVWHFQLAGLDLELNDRLY